MSPVHISWAHLSHLQQRTHDFSRLDEFLKSCSQYKHDASESDVEDEVFVDVTGIDEAKALVLRLAYALPLNEVDAPALFDDEADEFTLRLAGGPHNEADVPALFDDEADELTLHVADVALTERDFFVALDDADEVFLRLAGGLLITLVSASAARY